MSSQSQPCAEKGPQPSSPQAQRSDGGFTPGPWRTSYNFGVAHHVVRQAGGLIAVCDAGDYATGRAEGEANARLIAAAPDLVEVARLLLRVDDEWKALSMHERSGVEDILSRATGGSDNGR